VRGSKNIVSKRIFTCATLHPGILFNGGFGKPSASIPSFLTGGTRKGWMRTLS
jgi:hypothetical protein